MRKDTFTSRMLGALEHAEFRRLWAATAFSQSSAWALIVARAALALNETGASSAAGIVTFAAMMPSVVMSPVAGYLADRFDRRRVLAAAYGVNLAQNAILAALVITGNLEFWQLVVLSTVNGFARATQMPAAQALLPNLVPRSKLVNAVAFHHATVQGAKLFGALVHSACSTAGLQRVGLRDSLGLYVGGAGAGAADSDSVAGGLWTGAGAPSETWCRGLRSSINTGCCCRCF